MPTIELVSHEEEIQTEIALRKLNALQPNQQYGYSDDIESEKGQLIGQELEKIRAQGRLITPDSILAEARKLDNPLHSFFTWDDTLAAYKWRKEQARKLIQQLTIITTLPTGEVVREKAHFSIVRHRSDVPESPAQPSYFSVNEVKDNEEMRESVRQDAWRELTSWSRKYEKFGFIEFEAIFRFVDEHCK